MTIFTDFCTLVSEEINLGTEFDTRISKKVKQAVRMFEKKLDFPYMRREYTAAVAIGDTSVSIPTLLGSTDINNFKKVRYVGLPLSTGKVKFLPKVETVDVTEVDSLDIPAGGYYVDGLRYVKFDREINEAMTIRVGVAVYTDLTLMAADATTTDTTEDTMSYHWLIKNAERALLLQTLLNLADGIRDPDLAAIWKNQLYGSGEQLEMGSEWDLLAQYVEEYDATNTNLFMNPFKDKASA